MAIGEVAKILWFARPLHPPPCCPLICQEILYDHHTDWALHTVYFGDKKITLADCCKKRCRVCDRADMREFFYPNVKKLCTYVH